MRLSWLLTVTLLSCAGCTSPPEATDLESLIARHVDARGGAPAIEQVRTFESDIHIVEPTFEVDGIYQATRDGSMRIDIRIAGERVFTEALHQGRGWSWSPEAGVREASEKGVTALRHGIEFPLKLFGLHEMRRRGHRLELVGSETVAGVNYHVVRLTLDDGFECRYYVNPETWLIERERTRRAMHVDVDPTEQSIETVYSDFRPVSGVLYPHQHVERVVDSGQLLSTATIRSIRINAELDPSKFLPSLD
ncbi:MAG: hypothetical protein ACREJC_19395 [Tepidisphaeraceae bacterium]